jgi:hypothetical protein
MIKIKSRQEKTTQENSFIGPDVTPERNIGRCLLAVSKSESTTWLHSQKEGIAKGFAQVNSNPPYKRRAVFVPVMVLSHWGTYSSSGLNELTNFFLIFILFICAYNV